MMCLRDELSAEVAGIAWVHFIVKLRTGVKMGGAMSLIAIGWDGYIRASGGANIMRKKNQLTMAVGKAKKFSIYLETRRLLTI